MKKRFISLVLALILAVSCLILPASGADPFGTAKYLDLPKAFHIYPHASVDECTLVKGGHTTLTFFTSDSFNVDYLFYCVQIYRGGMEEVNKLFSQGKDPEVIDFFYESAEDLWYSSGPGMNFKWTADSRYSVGDYTLVCYLLDMRTEKIYDDRPLYWTELHVVSGKRSAKGMNVYVLKEDGAYEVLDNDILQFDQHEIAYFELFPDPITATEKLDWSVYSTPSAVAGGRKYYGYLSFGCSNLGMARVSIVAGKYTRTFWAKCGKFDETKELKIYRSKDTLCIGEEEKIEVKSKSDPDKYKIGAVWSSSDPNVATVGTRGEVKALKPGKVRITAVAGAFKETVEYTVQYHQLPEGTPVTTRTATQPRQSIGHCSACGKDDAVNIYEPAIFTDTKATAWYAEHVDKVYDLKLMNGTGEHTFAPNANVNRAMAATVLYRIAGEPEIEGESPFGDVPAGKYFTNAVIWAEKNGIVNGYPDGTFRPGDNITREQLAAILYRYAAAEGKAQAEPADLSGFPDAGKVHSYATEAMAWAVGAGLINGVGSDGKSYLQPANNATRAQFATIISRYMESVDPLIPVKPEPALTEVQASLTRSNDGADPENVKVSSVAELQKYLDDYHQGKCPDGFDPDKYGDAYFVNNALLFTLVKVCGSSPMYSIEDVGETEETISVRLEKPDEPESPDMCSWILMLEVANSMPERKIEIDTVTVPAPADES